MWPAVAIQVLVLILMMKMIKCDVEVIVVPRGASVRLPSGLSAGHGWEIRWTHIQLLLTNQTSVCPDSHCQLMKDGSLSFNKVGPRDVGNYTMNIFNKHGKLMKTKTFTLTVEDLKNSQNSSSGSTNLYYLLLFAVIIIFIIIFIFRRRRRSQNISSADHVEDTYQEMRSYKIVSEKVKKEEQSFNVPYYPAIGKEEEPQEEEEENVYVIQTTS